MSSSVLKMDFLPPTVDINKITIRFLEVSHLQFMLLRNLNNNGVNTPWYKKIFEALKPPSLFLFSQDLCGVCIDDLNYVKLSTLVQYI